MTLTLYCSALVYCCQGYQPASHQSVRISLKPRDNSSQSNIHQESSHVTTTGQPPSQLTCCSPRGCDTTEVAGTSTEPPPPLPPPASLLRLLRQHGRQDVSVSGPAYSPHYRLHTEPSLISRAKPSQTSQVLRPPSASHGRWIVRVVNEKLRQQNHQLRQRERMKRSFV